MNDQKINCALTESRLNDGLGYAEDEEHFLRETIAMLKESYDKAVKPYIDRLVMIQCHRKPDPIFVTIEQARAMGFEVPNVE